MRCVRIQSPSIHVLKLSSLEFSTVENSVSDAHTADQLYHDHERPNPSHSRPEPPSSRPPNRPPPPPTRQRENLHPAPLYRLDTRRATS
ncbi:hypothetical protein FA95DRAFT_1566037 [Auriscalpium vulgare]|uniref:Uncharacterized protein n=1 Tax=Auriscalpium vulgare TaxID=40419 RepID=A0ACB8R9K0_9AGAM|nr:hypothetical protein FA95DRAFT_1566037 [Auriscalpium vulgare]